MHAGALRVEFFTGVPGCLLHPLASISIEIDRDIRERYLMHDKKLRRGADSEMVNDVGSTIEAGARGTSVNPIKRFELHQWVSLLR